MKKKQLQELTIIANEQINLLKKWYENYKEAFDYMNLKLYDAFFYGCSDMEKDFPLCYANEKRDFYFYDFCDKSYNDMEEDFEGSGLNLNDFHYPLGRTSSFYLHKQDIFQFERFEINWNMTLYGILEHIYGASCGSYTELTPEGEIDLEKSLEVCSGYIDNEAAYQYLTEEITWIASDMYADVLEYFSDMIEVYECITAFKNRQVEYFKEYLQEEEDRLQELELEAKEEERKRQEFIRKFNNIKLQSVLDKNIFDMDVLQEFYDALYC